MDNIQLIKKLKKASKNRDKTPYQDSKVLNILKDLPNDGTLNFWIHFALSWAVIDHFIRNDSTIDTYLVLHGILALITSVTIWKLAYLLNKVPPKKKINDWLWKQGRKVLFLQALLMIEFVILMPLHYPIEGVNNSILYFSATCYFYYWMIVLLGCNKPQILLSQFWTVSGAILNYFAFISFYIWYLTTTPNRRISLAVIIILGFGGFILLDIGKELFKNLRENGTLNSVQKDILQIIKPSDLLVSLRTKYEEIKDQLKAIKILEKLERKNQYGVQVALLNELTKQYTKKSNKWVYTIMTCVIIVLIFILESIGEGFFQDLLYDSYIKQFLCEKFGIVC